MLYVMGYIIKKVQQTLRHLFQCNHTTNSTEVAREHTIYSTEAL